MYLTGDEPHYIIITRSIVEHFTLDLTATYSELNWPKDQWHVVIGPGLGAGAYPFHGIGLPLLLVAPYLVAGVFGVLVFMCGISALIGAYIFRLSSIVTKSRKCSFVTAFVFGTGPFLAFSSQVYPDVVASLFALFIVEHGVIEQKNLPFVGALIGFSLFLHPKFILLLMIPAMYTSYVLVSGRNLRALESFLAPILILILIYCGYSTFYFGSLINRSYPIDFNIISNGLIGFLLDRQHGLFPYFPVLELGFLGLVHFARNREAKGTNN